MTNIMYLYVCVILSTPSCSEIPVSMKVHILAFGYILSLMFGFSSPCSTCRTCLVTKYCRVWLQNITHFGYKILLCLVTKYYLVCLQNITQLSYKILPSWVTKYYPVWLLNISHFGYRILPCLVTAIC